MRACIRQFALELTQPKPNRWNILLQYTLITSNKLVEIEVPIRWLEPITFARIDEKQIETFVWLKCGISMKFKMNLVNGFWNISLYIWHSVVPSNGLIKQIFSFNKLTNSNVLCDTVHSSSVRNELYLNAKYTNTPRTWAGNPDI